MTTTTPVRYGVPRPTPQAAVTLTNCTHCAAQAGNPCHTPSGRPTTPHLARTERAWSLNINRAHLARTRSTVTTR